MTAYNLENEAISASAGSGKTFQLAHRYIKLLAHGIEPDRIIALTFSRKASGEIFDTIVKHLSDAARSEEKARETAGRIGLPSTTQTDFLHLLRSLLVSLHRLHISTLDSFTISIIRAFPFELGIPSSFQMLDNQGAESQQLSREVLHAIFKSSQSDAALRTEFLSAFKDATYGQEEKSLEDRLDSFTGDFRTYYQKMPAAFLWGQETIIWPDGYPWLVSAGDAKAAADELSASFASSDFTDKLVDSLTKILNFAGTYSESSAWDEKVTKSAVFQRLLEDYQALEHGNYSLKYLKNEYPLTARQSHLMLQLLRQIMGTELRNAAKRTQGIYRILDQYEQGYDAMIRRRGKLTFTDAQYLLTDANEASSGAVISRMQGAGGKLYIDYRLDCRLDHWLLDEFQDTSDLQWEVLGNLIDEIVQDSSRQRSLFYVGDMKQAIYSWRGGNTQLFNRILNRYAGHIVKRPLSTSYRSCQAVIDTVNAVFGDLSGSGLPEETVNQWHNVWETHRCSEELAQASGFTAILEPDCQNGSLKPDKEDRYDIVAGLLKEINPLSKGLSTAILVRSNDAGKDIANYLRGECPGMTIIHEGRAAIRDNAVVAVLLALVKFAAHPGDMLAWRHLQMSPINDYFVSHHLSKHSLPMHVLHQIQTSGYQSFARTWGTRLNSIHELDGYGRKKLNDLVTAAGEFDQKGSGDCNEFLDFIESYETLDSTAEQSIRVMTIHQAKGLGFDIVILPDLNLRNDMTTGKSAFLTASNPATDDPLWTLKMPRRIVAEHDPALANWLHVDDEKGCFDELCMLYVALTRARRGLYMITSYPGKSASILNHAAFLKLQLTKDTKPVEGHRFTISGEEHVCLYQTGERDWFLNVRQEMKPALPPSAELPVLFEISAGQQRPVSIIPSAMGEGAIPASSLFAATHRDSIDLGNAVHQLFEKVRWSDSIDIEKCVQDWQKTTRLTQDLAEQAIGQFIHALESIEISQALAPSEGNIDVWKERAFEVVVDNQWITGAFDRVLITKNVDGSVTHAIIMDFKTNDVTNDSEIAATAERYRPQLALYRKALAQILKLKPSRIAIKLLFTQPGRVYDL